MKILFTLLFCLGFLAFEANAQALFTQDFENGIDPMTIHDLDGRTPATNVAQYTEAWNIFNPTFGNGSNVAISNSWYVPAGIADDWMITPGIFIGEAGTILRWEAKAQDASFRDGYQVLVSSAGNQPTDFTDPAEFETAGELTTWQTRQLNLDGHVGDTIYIAFRNNSNDKFLLLVDNIFVGIPKDRDVTLKGFNANINFGVALEGDHSINIEMQNLGSQEITSAQAMYILNGDTAIQELTGLSVAPGSSYSFTHETPADFVEGENQTLVVEISQVNGDTDENPLDNVLGISGFKVWPPVPNFDLVSTKGENYKLHDILAEGKAVVIDFFASWCVPCETSTPALNSFYINNGSGDEDFEVIGLTIEPTDTDAIVDGLGWGATYPKFSYTTTNDEFYAHFNSNHGLGEGAIPFFVMICPNTYDISHSPIYQSYVGASNIQTVFNVIWQNSKNACINNLTAVEEIDIINDISLYPNPVSDHFVVDFQLDEPAEMQFEIVDVVGKTVNNLGSESFSTGQYIREFSTEGLANGVYFFRMTQGNAVKTLKINVVR